MASKTMEMADFICEYLSLCYGDSRESLEQQAQQMDCEYYEQFVAAGLAQLLTDRFEFHPKPSVD